MRYEQYPQRTPTQTKAINKLYNVGPDGFINGISTEKYVNLCRFSRATAYRELTAPCEMGVLVKTGAGGDAVQTKAVVGKACLNARDSVAGLKPKLQPNTDPCSIAL